MQAKKFVYHEDEDMFVGWLEEFPDYRTQGATIEEITSGRISRVMRVDELMVG